MNLMTDIKTPRSVPIARIMSCVPWWIGLRPQWIVDIFRESFMHETGLSYTNSIGKWIMNLNYEWNNEFEICFWCYYVGIWCFGWFGIDILWIILIMQWGESVQQVAISLILQFANWRNIQFVNWWKLTNFCIIMKNY